MHALPPIEIHPDTFLKRHFTLPPLPELVTRLLDLIRSGDAGARQVGELLGADPGMTAQVLKVVNSAYYGLPKQIADVTHAVAYLGLAEVQRLVLAISVMKELAPKDRSDFERFWSHSYYTALIARRLVRTYEKSLDAEDLYVAALLHDIGKLVYLRFFPDHFHELESWAEENQRFFADAETHYGWPGHAMLGTLLCRYWRLPELVEQACECHELDDLRRDLDSRQLHPLVRTVALANMLSNLAMAPLDEGLRKTVSETVQRSLGCPHEEFLLLMGDVYDLESEVSRFLEELTGRGAAESGGAS